MTVNRRLLFLLTVLLVLSTAFLAINGYQFRNAELRNSRLREMYAQSADVADQRESEALESGDLWIGELHKPIVGTVSKFAMKSIDLTRQRRASGTVQFHDGLSATMKLHECYPGTSLCTSGGSITVCDGERTICGISVVLCGVEGESRVSRYRVNWSPEAGDRYETGSAKHEFLKSFGGEGLVPDHEKFQSLLRSAYGYEQEARSDYFPQIKRTIICTVIRAIVIDSSHEARRTTAHQNVRGA